jgi:glyoxylase-like metal-dependent hydrolase (beta-lactamase superfamily II)
MCPFGRRFLLGDGGLLEKGRIVAHCLLIEAGDELVLVDTGYGLGDCRDPKARLTLFFREGVRPELIEGETAIRQVEALGHDPEDVRHIVVTHLDADHAGGISDFPDAQVHLFETELAAALERSTLKEKERYRPLQWGDDPNWVSYGAGGDDWFGFESIRVIPGLDAEIALIPLTGHTRGHSGVAINSPGGWLLHCGDAFFFEGEIETPRRCPPGFRLFQRINDQDSQARHHNQDRLRELQRTHGDEVTLFCSHDERMLEAMNSSGAAGLTSQS